MKDAEYYRKYRATKRNLVATETQPVNLQPINWVNHVPESAFDGKGRGVPVNGFVMVKRRMEVVDGLPDIVHGILAKGEWMGRLEVKCPHGFSGFAHDCL